jgi:predicted lipid-binding transport protein (Tim44 family)
MGTPYPASIQIVARLPILIVSLFLVHAPAALAVAGGGSGGYGGGGGGGGGGYSGGGGSGGSGSGGFSLGGLLIVAGIVAAVMIFGWVGAARYRKRRRERVARVRAAAAEAAEDDAAFAHDEVVREAERLFHESQAAWDARDHAALEALVPPDLWTEWKRRLDDFERKGWHNRVEVLDMKAVEYVGLTNRPEDRDDRCVVRIEAQLRDYVVDRTGTHITRNDSSSEITTLAQYWTLGKIGDTDRWRLVSIEERAEGDHHLAGKIVASPWGDDARLHDEAVVEGAVAEAPAGVKTSEIADLDFAGDARAAANDLALADPRFEPAVLEAAARRAVAAWAEAVDGEDAGLAAVATPEALRALLHPNGNETRLVVRGPEVRRLRITALDAASDPATMTIEVDVAGRRYVEDRDTTTVVSGSRDTQTEFTERWTLALDGTDDTPWRIVDAAAPSRA